MTDDGSYLFLWKGNRVANTVTAQLQSTGLIVHNNGLAVQVYSVSPAELKARLKQLVEIGPADAIVLARTVQNKQFEKYHPYLSEELLCQDYAISMLDTAGAWAALRAVSSEES
jgi:ATP-dependent Lhr-like helicase